MVSTKIKSAFRKNFYEKEAWASGKLVIGVDEVGRGCLAGPVVAAAALLPAEKDCRLLRDSKELDEESLETAFRWIAKHAKYGVGVIPSWVVDEFNIYRASQLAMKRACAGLVASLVEPVEIAAILVDAVPLDFSEAFPPVYHFIKGESKSKSIAAASIVAKVFRDRLMRTMAQSFERYELAEHKGYATEKHRQALEAWGRSVVHRTTFGVLSKECDEQVGLFS